MIAIFTNVCTFPFTQIILTRVIIQLIELIAQKK